jgi:CBS domain-containing protein
MTVKAILSRKGNAVITIKPTVLLCDAVKILDEHQIGAAVIIDADQHIVGILSERDIVRLLARNIRVAGACRLCDESVGEVMTREIETCTQSDTIHEIMERMTIGKFRHLPVVEHGRLVGIVSIGDAVNYRLREMEFESNAMHEYILKA